VVAVVGDAAISSGMSWEALNHGGDLGLDVSVVLNDNRMSIAPNVGALVNYLAKLRSRPTLQNLAQKAKQVVERMPDPITRVAAGLRHGITHYLAPEETGTIFEEMGWEYIGPVDGHDLGALVEVFRNVRELKGPTFVHAITVKGKGYEVAEEDARKWHGVTPFDVERCEMAVAAGARTFTATFGEAAVECADSDERVVAITAAMPDGTGLVNFARTHPDRFFDVGIAEQHAVTLAAGMAAGGLRPFCAIYSTFLQRGFDQVLHDVCIQNLPVRFFLDRAGLVGEDGATHHGVFDLSYLCCIPNITVMAPRDNTELAEMVRFAAAFDSGPIAVRYPRGSGDDRLPEARSPIELGRAEVLARGDDLTLVALGSMVAPAVEAARQLAERGIHAEVINARFAKPLDRDTIRESARRTGWIVTIEENVASGGFGEQVRSALSDLLPGVRHTLLAVPDAFIEHGSQALLRRQCGLDAEGIVERVLHETRRGIAALG